jgi:hypothetical protein
LGGAGREERAVASSHWDLEVLAAGLRRHSSDLSMYAGFLLNTLSSALPPEMVRVERRGGGLLGRLRGAEAPVVAVSVVIGDRSYTLRRAKVGAPAVATIRHESGGVALRTETVGVDGWSRQLAAALAGYAEQNAAAAEALARLTLPGTP